MYVAYRSRQAEKHHLSHDSDIALIYIFIYISATKRLLWRLLSEQKHFQGYVGHELTFRRLYQKRDVANHCRHNIYDKHYIDIFC